MGIAAFSSFSENILVMLVEFFLITQNTTMNPTAWRPLPDGDVNKYWTYKDNQQTFEDNDRKIYTRTKTKHDI